MKGQVCWMVKKNGFEFLVSDLDTRISEFENRILTGSEVYRKPGAGMIYRAANDFEIDLTKSWMIGDRDEDEKAAKAAGLSFMPAEIWHMRFTPRHLLQAGEPVQRSGSGMYEIRDARGLANASLSATPQQVKFLEGVNLN